MSTNVERIPADQLKPGDRFKRSNSWWIYRGSIPRERWLKGIDAGWNGALIVPEASGRNQPVFYIAPGELIEVDRTPRLLDQPLQPMETP